MAKKKSMNGKGSFAAYKNENRVLKNKIAKLERHIKECPQDEQAKSALEKIKKSGYTGRTEPKRSFARTIVLPGSNEPISLNRLSGRLSPVSRRYQKLVKIANKGLEVIKYLPKEEREAVAKKRK